MKNREQNLLNALKIADYSDSLRHLRDVFPSFSQQQRQIVLYLCLEFNNKEIRQYLKTSSKNLSEQKRKIREKIIEHYRKLAIER